MSKGWRNRRVGIARRTCRFFAKYAVGATALACALFTGCSSHQASTQAGHDPLKGIMAPPTAVPVPNQQQAMNNGAALPPGNYQGGIPAIPTTFGPTNNASLAAMTVHGPLGRPLAIDDDGKPRPTADWTRPGTTIQTPTMPNFPGPASSPRVERVPASDATPLFAPAIGWQSPGTPTPATQTANAAPPALATPSVNPLEAQLKERGVLKHSVEQTADGVLLTCFLSRGPAGGIRILEANAADYTSAAQVILERLSQESRVP